VALVARETQKSGEMEERLIIFPTQKIKSQQAKEFRLKRVFGKDEFVELAAHKLSEGSDNESARWHVEIMGNGELCRTLLSKLSGYRK
jgi:hypothetical protein